MLQKLGTIVKESIDVYTSFLELEKTKYDVLVNDNYTELDDIMQEEQVYYLKLRGLEHKKDRIIKEAGLEGKTLSEIIELENSSELLEEYNKFIQIVSELKETHDLCKIVIDIRLRRASHAISELNNIQKNTSSEAGINKTV